MTPGRYYGLDLWRGVACLLVLVYHVFGYRPSESDSTAWWLTERAWVGVPMFFVISGYCIAAAAHAGRARGDRPGEFFQRIGLGARRLRVVRGIQIQFARLGVENLKRHAARLRQYRATHLGVCSAACVFAFISKTLAVGVHHDRIRIHVTIHAVAARQRVRRRNGVSRHVDVLRRGIDRKSVV